jgi:hypothetical protein
LGDYFVGGIATAKNNEPATKPQRKHPIFTTVGAALAAAQHYGKRLPVTSFSRWLLRGGNRKGMPLP